MLSLILKIFSALLPMVAGIAAEGSEVPVGPPLMSSLYLQRLSEVDHSIHAILEEVFIDLTLSVMHPKWDQLKTHLQSLLDDYSESSGQVLQGKDQSLKISGNPLLVLRLIFRHAVDLAAIEDQLRRIGNERGLKTLLRLREAFLTLVKPNAEILENAAERLHQIVEAHGLDLHQVAAGTLQNISTGIRLERRHCSYLSQQASKYGFHALAVEWAEVALRMATEANDAAAITKAKELLDNVTSKHDTDLETEVDYPDCKFFHKKLSNGEIQERDKRRVRTLADGKYSEVKLKYYGICSGQNFQTEETKAELFCWNEYKAHPMWRINPLKAELLSASPLLLQLYDIITVADAESLIDAAEPILQSMKLSRPSAEIQGGKRVFYRSSFNTVFQRGECGACVKLYSKIERLTKLRTNSRGAEDIQLGAYTYGGHFLPHNDPPRREFYPSPVVLPEGIFDSRLATFMVYLSNVESGGVTAFPEIGVGVRPIFGSALFWLNLDDNEAVDKRLTHAACPLILGGPKWVATTWIRLREQFLALKCPAS